MLPTKEAATTLLHEHVTDEYQRLHALMVATALEGYALDLGATAALGLDQPPGLTHMENSNPAFGLSNPAHPLLVRENPDLWYVTGLLHDLDFQQHPAEHPGPSLQWFREWKFPDTLIHAVEAHAYGYHDFTTLPRTRLAAALLATDELCGIIYAYRKMNPVAYGDMKPSSIRKKFKDPGIAAKVDRKTIQLGCEHLGVALDDHIANVIRFLAPLP